MVWTSLGSEWVQGLSVGGCAALGVGVSAGRGVLQNLKQAGDGGRRGEGSWARGKNRKKGIQQLTRIP